MDQIPLPLGQDPEKVSLHQASSILTWILSAGARQSLSRCSSHWPCHSESSCGLTFYLNWECLTQAVPLSFSYQGRDVAEETEDNSCDIGPSTLPLFWKVRLTLPRNPFHSPHGTSWPSTSSAGNKKCLYPEARLCLCQQPTDKVHHLPSFSRLSFPWFWFWRSKTTAGVFLPHCYTTLDFLLLVLLLLSDYIMVQMEAR